MTDHGGRSLRHSCFDLVFDFFKFLKQTLTFVEVRQHQLDKPHTTATSNTLALTRYSLCTNVQFSVSKSVFVLQTEAPCSLRNVVRNDRLLREKFRFSVSVLQRAESFNQPAWEHLKNRAPPYGWEGIPADGKLRRPFSIFTVRHQHKFEMMNCRPVKRLDTPSYSVVFFGRVE